MLNPRDKKSCQTGLRSCYLRILCTQDGSCRDISAAEELRLEVWDVGGSQGSKQLQKMSQDPNNVIENARFLGSVEVAMTSTLAMHRGQLQINLHNLGTI